MQQETIIGIDLGTTYSLCCVFVDGQPRLIDNALGETLTPSAVAIDEKGTVLVGAPAKARVATHSKGTAVCFKRDMGTERVLDLGGQRFRPEELSAMVLRSLKADAERALGDEVREAVITVPAYFGDAQRQATRMAGELAGLKVDRIINEPTAAALAYGLNERDREFRAVVLDLGGGTFDVTVLEVIEGIIEVQASAGDARLGGEDFTDALADSMREQIATEFDWEATDLPRVREAAERAKRVLTDKDEAPIALPALKGISGERDISLVVTRRAAETAWQPLLERLRAPIARALRDAKCAPADVEEVLLVGGATRTPALVQLAATVFDRLPNRSLPPDETVARGAAVQAALKQQDEAVEDLVVTDVAPFTMGISTASIVGRNFVEGLFSPILERGTVIPASRSEVFQTMEDGQQELLVEVYQGEHSACADNTKLGDYAVKGLPPKPAGEVHVEVRFTYDLNGILEVEMTVQGTGRREHLVIERSPGRMSPAHVEAARDAMRRLKFHPRETLPNRTALERADAVYAELAGVDRQVLGIAIARFRAALESQQETLIRGSREELIAATLSFRTGAPQ